MATRGCFVGFVRNKYASSPGRPGGGREIGAGLIRTGTKRSVGCRPSRWWPFLNEPFAISPTANGYLPLLARSLTFTRPPCPSHPRLSSYSPLCPRPPSSTSPPSPSNARSHPLYLLVARAVAVERPPVSLDNVYWKIYSNIFN